MLSDPQSVTIDGATIDMPRISSGNMTSQYSDASGATKLRVSHTANRRERSLVRLDLSKVGADPLMSTVSRTYSASVYLVIDTPLNGAGFSDEEIKEAAEGFLAYCSDTGFLAKILGKES